MQHQLARTARQAFLASLLGIETQKLDSPGRQATGFLASLLGIETTEHLPYAALNHRCF